MPLVCDNPALLSRNMVPQSYDVHCSNTRGVPEEYRTPNNQEVFLSRLLQQLQR